jgi:hypothetical protein
MTYLFDHFIITRFNLTQTIWKNDKKGQIVNNMSWLQKRYELFERYCFPSIQLQTEQNFKWLVYFDVETPDVFKTKNELLKKDFSSFKPIYVSSFKDFEQSLLNDIENYKSEHCNYVLTTRLDNDDCLHKDAVKVIQQHFKPVNKAIIDLKNGLALQIVNTYKLSLKKDTISGPFITLIEEYKDPMLILTVYNREHLSWIGEVEFINIGKGFYWLQIIHQNNLTNELSNQLTYDKRYLKGFVVYHTVRFSFRYRIFILLKTLGILAFVKKIIK